MQTRERKMKNLCLRNQFQEVFKVSKLIMNQMKVEKIEKKDGKSKQNLLNIFILFIIIYFI